MSVIVYSYGSLYVRACVRARQVHLHKYWKATAVLALDIRLIYRTRCCISIGCVLYHILDLFTYI
jgi:hypothetical protein